MKPSKVLVVGGGIAGMSAALLLRMRGTAVDLVDIDPEWRVYGAGITVTGPTLRAFQEIGILDEIKAEGALTAGGQLFDVAGRFLGDVPHPPKRDDIPGTGGILRPVLHRILSSRVRAAQVDVRLGITVEAFDQREAATSVRFSDGSTRDYDLVIGADGIYSKVRALLFPDAPSPRRTGQGCWRVLAPRPEGLDRSHLYLGGEVKVGLNPCSAHHIYLFALEAVDADEWIDPAAFAARLKGLLAPFGGIVAGVREGITEESSIVYRPLEALLLPRPWHVGRAVLIGDAVHATTPHLASGAGISVEDAIVLVRALDTDAPLEDALTAFEERRYERCRIVVENSLALGEIEQGRGDAAEYQRIMGSTNALLNQPL